MNEMKKILFFTDTPLVGGAELQMFLLAKFLNATAKGSIKKYEISLACLSNPSLDRWCKLFSQEGITVYRLSVLYKNNPKIFFELRRISKEKGIDLVHIHLWNPASGKFAFLAAQSLNIPYLVTEHDPFRLSPLKRGLKRYLIKQPSALIAISKENQNFLEQEYRGKLQEISLVPNGIDVDFWETQVRKLSAIDRKYIRKEIFGLEENAFVLINVAALHERKGQETLIRAFEKVLKMVKEKRLRLFLVGEGEHREKFENLVSALHLEDSVKFLGERKDIPELLASADLFVFPSHREGFGLAILEAGMARLPVIASRVGGIVDIIEDEKEGILVSPRDPEVLANAIIELINDEVKRLVYGSSLHEKVLTKFHAKKMAEKTEAVYDKILIARSA